MFLIIYLRPIDTYTQQRVSILKQIERTHLFAFAFKEKHWFIKEKDENVYPFITAFVFCEQMNELIKVQIGHVEVYLFIIIHTIFGTFLDYIYIFGLYFWDEYLGLGLNLYVSVQ